MISEQCDLNCFLGGQISEEWPNIREYMAPGGTNFLGNWVC